MNVEVFPAEKSCEQGCAVCPLARRDRAVTATAVDPAVQETFSLVEEVLHRKNVPYNLHFTSALHLFPALQYPELIRMSRFETSKEIRSNGNAAHFSDSIRALLGNHGIDPKVLGFSIVPEYPVVSERDIRAIRAGLEELSSWYFTSGRGSIEVNVRSNLIEPSLFDEVLPHLFASDNVLLKSALPADAVLVKWRRRNPIYDLKWARLYYNEYVAEIGNRKISITNRVMSSKPVDDLHKSNCEQALSLAPRKGAGVDYAITPKGVMIVHTSVSVNNPILWLGHNDFRNTLKREIAKPGFSLLRFAQQLIGQNTAMYQEWLKHTNDGDRLTNADVMDLFERWRATGRRPRAPAFRHRAGRGLPLSPRSGAGGAVRSASMAMQRLGVVVDRVSADP